MVVEKATRGHDREGAKRAAFNKPVEGRLRATSVAIGFVVAIVWIARGDEVVEGLLLRSEIRQDMISDSFQDVSRDARSRHRLLVLQSLMLYCL